MEEAKSIENIWGISDSVIEKNNAVTNDIMSDNPDENKVAENINGYVINEVGNIVAQFGFFVENDNDETVDIQISKDGFLSKIYNEDTNIILGYGHELGFTGMVDPKKSQILHLGPEAANGSDIVVSVTNDETLSKQGMILIIRDKDVVIDILPNDLRDDYIQSIEDAKDPIDELNEIETSYNQYMRHMYNILGEERAPEVMEEEFYE